MLSNTGKQLVVTHGTYIQLKWNKIKWRLFLYTTKFDSNDWNIARECKYIEKKKCSPQKWSLKVQELFWINYKWKGKEKKFFFIDWVLNSGCLLEERAPYRPSYHIRCWYEKYMKKPKEPHYGELFDCFCMQLEYHTESK